MTSEQYQCSEQCRSAILEAARDAGACAAGFATAHPLPYTAQQQLTSWLNKGHNADMQYMERYSNLRADPATLLDDTRAILAAAFCYRNKYTPRSPLFADYALGDDYHEVLRQRLKPIALMMEQAVEASQTRICIDTAPIRERYWAIEAGIGFLGLNNQIIVDDAGSHVFLAEILWTASVRPDAPAHDRHCLGCRACIKACPGGALDGNSALDSRRCLSYLSIEHRADLPDTPALQGRKIYGCDICRDVCPHNKNVTANVIEEFTPRPRLISLSIEDIETMTPEQYAETFRHSAVKRLKLPLLKRNANKH